MVKVWLYDLELEDLSSGKQRDVEQIGIVIKAPLSRIWAPHWRFCLSTTPTPARTTVTVELCGLVL